MIVEEKEHEPKLVGTRRCFHCYLCINVQLFFFWLRTVRELPFEVMTSPSMLVIHQCMDKEWDNGARIYLCYSGFITQRCWVFFLMFSSMFFFVSWIIFFFAQMFVTWLIENYTTLLGKIWKTYPKVIFNYWCLGLHDSSAFCRYGIRGLSLTNLTMERDEGSSSDVVSKYF